jgi:hypothetical protein
MLLKQILYLGHWIIKLDMPTFRSFLNYAQKKNDRTKISLLLDIVYCVLRYKISIYEYFYFNFFLKGKEERKTYAGTPCQEEYLAKINPIPDRFLVDNKLIFFETYAPFIKHSYATLADFKDDNESAANVLHNKSGKIVLKNPFGEGGKGIEVISAKNLNSQAIYERLKATGNTFVEEWIIQHKDLMKLSPSGLNTCRIVTMLNNNGDVDILATILRISVNRSVDNWHAGNIAARINPSTGLVENPAFYMDITKPDEYCHPITGVEIVGFKIPFWKEAIQMVKDAAFHNTKSRSIGWDIAITDNGPDFIEGNSTWCKVIWQRSFNKGLKSILASYI